MGSPFSQLGKVGMLRICFVHKDLFFHEFEKWAILKGY
jgi:hypothetical protein